MAKIASTRKVFNFRVEIAGVDQWEIQKVTIPEVEIEAVSHHDTNYAVKTAGKISVGDLVFEKIRPLNGNDTWAWAWLMQAQNPITGGGLLPINIKHIILIKEMDNTGILTLNRWICEGCWVKKISQASFDRGASDNIIETITMSVDTVVRL